MSWCYCQLHEECDVCRPATPDAKKPSAWETIKQERDRLREELEEALMKIEIHENTINDLHLKIAFLES